MRKSLRKSAVSPWKTAIPFWGLTYSPVKGPEGNIEYLIYLERSEEPVQNPQAPPARQVVEQSHQALDKPAEG